MCTGHDPMPDVILVGEQLVPKQGSIKLAELEIEKL